MIASPTSLKAATDHLSRHDPIMAAVIASVGPCTVRPHTNYYQELVQSILGQQLSLQAAAAIEARFVALFAGQSAGTTTPSLATPSEVLANSFPSPAQLVAVNPDDLRSAGLSRAKVAYVQDLAAHVLDGRIHFEHLESLSNDEIIAELTAVKGIGEWTAHMFLLFAVGRLDVLPVGDLGIRNGVRALYGVERPPSPQDIRDIAARNHWHPYESVASWYVWQSLNLPAASF